MHRWLRSILLSTLLALALGHAAVAEPPQLVAVMELGHANATLPPAALQILEESIRSRTSDTLLPLGYGLLPKDRVLSVLYDNGIDATKACDSTCAIESGRELKARFVVEGIVSTMEGTHVAFVRVLDTKTGEIIGTLKARGATAVELEKSLDAHMDELFEKAGLRKPVRVPAPATPSSQP